LSESPLPPLWTILFGSETEPTRLVGTSKEEWPKVVRELPLDSDTDLASAADLVSAATGGDESAFDALVGPLIEPGFKLAALMLRDREEARDAVQEACVMAWRGLPQLREEARLRPWFLAIVANQCRDVRRTRWWSIVRLPVISRGNHPAGADLEAQLDLDREFRGLPTRQRAALFLFFYADLPLAEVAKVLNVSPQAAKSLVHRAVVKLRLSMVEVPT
jgi:RNA polymerase sigma-70 factor (ECF subfamily)